MTDDLLHQHDCQVPHEADINNDSDIRMRNGSAMRNLADNLTNVILRDYPHALAHHDRRLLEEFFEWRKQMLEREEGIKPPSDWQEWYRKTITAFLAQREGE